MSKKKNKAKQLSNPFSTGGGGAHFEARVQATYVVMMLAGGYAPCLPAWPIVEIKLQGKIDGFNTDDLIVFVENIDTKERRKLLGQVKHGLIIGDNPRFREVISSAWRDFRDPKLFTKSNDIIAVISDDLDSKDCRDYCWILEQARTSVSSEAFLRNVNTAKFSSKSKTKKLEITRMLLRGANNDVDISDAELHEFLKHFQLLGYDFGKNHGVVQSLIYSHFAHYNIPQPEMLWGRLLDEVQRWNQNAGTITKYNLPDDVRSEFQKPSPRPIPDGIVRNTTLPVQDLGVHPKAHDLALAFILGGWSENNDADVKVVSGLVGVDYDKWIAIIRDILDSSVAPLALRNGVWKTKQSRDAWQSLARKLYDKDIISFERLAIEVLREINPAFDLTGDERIMAGIRGKVLKHSGALRDGIANSLSAMGGMPKLFIHCSDNKAENVARLVVRQVLEKSDWRLWGTLNHLLPLLAEAAPSEFLDAIEHALAETPSPFSRLFAEEGQGVFGNNYMVGVLWALETLAWEEQYLARVTVILGELHSIDPGGNWGNRPSNSLTTIFLPWLPQTTASVSRRINSIKTLAKESPGTAWPIILRLLPNQHQSSMGSHKPKWRQSLPEKRIDGFPSSEYWEQVISYADLALDLAGNDVDRLGNMVERLNDLPGPCFEKLINRLESGDVRSLPESERERLWSESVDFIARHRRFADAKWAMSGDLLKKVEAASTGLAPTDPSNYHKRLFNGKDFDHYEESGNWKEQEEELGQRRQRAISEIYDKSGIDSVIEFVQVVESPSQVGTAFGCIATEEDDIYLLPRLLDHEGDKIARFIGSYIWARRWKCGWDWVDKTISAEWSALQLGRFMCRLPFGLEAWSRVDTNLNGAEELYWKHVQFNPLQAKDDYNTAIDKLLEHGRAVAAIDCLYASHHEGRPIDHARIVKALLGAVAIDEKMGSLDVFHAVELIKALQDDKNTNPRDLFSVEWAYLSALNDHCNAEPKHLERQLAEDPSFFCELIQAVFRSRKEEINDKEPSELQQRIAKHAYRLLEEWKIPPGLMPDGSFSPDNFIGWLKNVCRICDESGHLEVALSRIGHVLIHTPPEPNGLWIHKAVADALNAKHAEKMRSGFESGLINSRGVHNIVSSGAPEDELANGYTVKADEVEAAGFMRLAGTMRNLADYYTKEAERIRKDYQHDETVGEALDE